MPLPRISVRIGRTINMGNYSSLKVEAGLEEDVQLGVPYDRDYKRLWNEVNSEINRAIKAFEQKKAGT